MSLQSVGQTGSLLSFDDTRMDVYLQPDKPKLSFFQKVGRFFGKALSFLGPIGAAVTAIALPGFGAPLAAGLYGLSDMAGKLTARAEAKDANKMFLEQQAQAGKVIGMPGLFEQASQVPITPSFIAPDSFIDQGSQTIFDREFADHSAVTNFQFY